MGKGSEDMGKGSIDGDVMGCSSPAEDGGKSLANRFRQARGNGNRHQVVSLTENGSRQWKNMVVPALQMAFDQPSLGELVPYGHSVVYSFTRKPDVCHPKAYYEGAQFFLRDVLGSVFSKDAYAMMVLSKVFACERYVEGNYIKNFDTQSRAEIEAVLRKRCSDIYKKGTPIPEEAVEDFRRGVALGAVEATRNLAVDSSFIPSLLFGRGIV